MRYAAPMRHPQDGRDVSSGQSQQALHRARPEEGRRPRRRCCGWRRRPTSSSTMCGRPRCAGCSSARTICSRVNPRLVYASLHGFGEQGPYAGRPAYDDLIQGMTALPALTGKITGEPRYSPATMADRIVGLNATHAILAALLASRPHRRGTIDRNPDVRNHGAVRARRSHGRPQLRAADRTARLFAAAVAGPPPLPDQRRLCLRAGLYRQAMERVLSRDRPRKRSRPRPAPEQHQRADQQLRLRL